MNKMTFYKGETINLLFFAVDENEAPIDISGYEKTVSVFTPGSPIVNLDIDGINASSFRATLSATASSNLIPGSLFVKLKLSSSSGVQIGRSTFPVLLLDPESPNSEDRDLQEGTDLEMKISLGEKIANVKIYMPTALTLIIQ